MAAIEASAEAQIRSSSDTFPDVGLGWVWQIGRHRSRMPDRIAIKHGDRSFTWAQLDDRTRRSASMLADNGIGPGDRVAILLINRVELIEVLVAVHRLGAIAAPINFRLVGNEIEYLLSDLGADAVVVDESLTSQLPQSALDGNHGTCVVVGADEGLPDGFLAYEPAIAAAEPSAANGPADLSVPALILYTSGTTGRPKGAVWTHQNLTATIMMMMQVFEMVSDDQVAAVTSPMFHMAALIHMIPSVFLGHKVVIVPSGNFDADKFLDLLEEERVTSVFLVPTQWASVCDAQQRRPRELRLRNLGWGAAPATSAILRLMADTFPNSSILSSFGQTESSITLLVKGPESRRVLGSVGRPLPMVDVRVVDSDMNEVPRGEPGEIVYRGPAVMSGFWNNETATAEAFRGGWFHSGDLVRQDEEGYFYVVDRIKDMIISGGENIYSAELELVLSEHPQVAEVAVVAAPHPKWGETPVAFVVPVDRAVGIDAEEFVEFCRTKLARYKVPSRIICADMLPRNATGKILKNRLRDQLVS
ncbi:AMP-binding protein [Rhodococcus pyridinivorans]|uniref:AMP-binding protein n=1 Tax=Rhodococcus pyridinivorans TaxID=103816 RepID=UPI001E2F4B69|nr:AMP-binding protein [Rhodococcus pyridinivorans]MCD5422453.1 AMP-binding protein [Rhodococcus pyridinivorans]